MFSWQRRKRHFPPVQENTSVQAALQGGVPEQAQRSTAELPSRVKPVNDKIRLIGGKHEPRRKSRSSDFTHHSTTSRV